MTVTIKKIRNYALFGTIISAAATAPAHATSLQNISDDNLTQNLDHEKASPSHKDIWSITNECSQAEFCILPPEQDEEDATQLGAAKPLQDLLLAKPLSSIESIQSAENTEAQVIPSAPSAPGVEHIRYKTEFTPLEIEPQSYSNLYTTQLYRAVGSSKRKKVPEPSALIGLIVFLMLAARSKKVADSPHNPKSFGHVSELLRRILFKFS